FNLRSNPLKDLAGADRFIDDGIQFVAPAAALNDSTCSTSEFVCERLKLRISIGHSANTGYSHQAPFGSNPNIYTRHERSESLLPRGSQSLHRRLHSGVCFNFVLQRLKRFKKRSVA